MPKYHCSICGTEPDEQKSHHTKHLKTKKHKTTKRILELELENNMTPEERMKKYGKTDVVAILTSMENVVSENNVQEAFAGDFNITNSDSLKQHIHSIHNYLRNHGGGYGLSALKIFNIFYGIKKLEEHGLNEMIGLSEEYWFSYLLKMSKEMTDEEFNHHIVNGLLNELYEKPLLKDFLFYEIPKNIKSDVFRYLIGEINDITRIEKESNVLLSGKVYEYFVGRDESAISELGAFFTNPIIVGYTIGKVNPQLDSNGNVPSMIDMFGGSGGFTTGYVNYMKEQYPNIDWMTNVNNIFHYDINEDVLKAAALEIFCLTGKIPNMANIAYKNSFKTEFVERPKYILTNPPYGGDKNKKTQAQEKRDILKKHIMSSPKLKEKHSKQLKFILSEERKEKKAKDKNKVSLETCSQHIIDYAKKHGLTGNDKESCSLILLMAMLGEGGTCAGVLKEGVMFDKKYKGLRKCLIENFNVREVVSIPADQFENTTTKTSLVIFDNTEQKTSAIKFSKLDVVKYTENKIEEKNGCLVLTEMAGDISGCQEVAVSTATIQDVQQNPIYSLNGKDYNKTEIVCGEDYELVELGSICELENGNAFKSTQYKETGIPMFTIKHLPDCNLSDCHYITQNEKYSNFIINKNDILIALSGNTIGKYGIYLNDFPSYLNQRVAKITISDIVTNKFIYYIFNAIDIQNKILNESNSSAQPNISSKTIEKMKIPVPKNPEKIQHWVDKISQPYNEKNEKQTRIQELEKTIQERIQSICDNEDCEEVELKDITDLNTGSTPNTKNNEYWNGTIPWCSVSELNNNYIYDTKKHITSDGEKTMLNRKVKKGSILMSYKLSIGKLGIAGCDMYCNEAIVIINSKIATLSRMYLYYLLSIYNFSKYGNGSIGKNGNLNKEILKRIKIKLPKNKKLIDDLNPLFQEIEEHQQAVKNADELYKQYIQELSNDAIPKP